MKYLLAAIILSIFTYCFPNRDNMLGNDLRLFEDTPAWEVAKAIRKDDTLKIKELLSGKPNSLLNYQEKRYGQSLLEWAVYIDKYSSTKVLAEFGANPNLKSRDCTSAFIQAADKNTSEFLKLLVKYGGNVNAVADLNDSQHLRTPLIAAAVKSFENVKILIEAGANPNYVHRAHGIQSALVSAFNSDNIDIINYLIIEVRVDFKKPTGFTINGDSLYVINDLRRLPYPLGSESYKKKMKLVKFLKERGMDYAEAPVPKHYYEIYDSAYLQKY